jgi:hypothetical protein
MNDLSFKARMRQICDEAPDRCNGYNPTHLRQMVDGCNSYFLPIAKRMRCSGEIQAWLIRLAKHDDLDISIGSSGPAGSVV